MPLGDAAVRLLAHPLFLNHSMIYLLQLDVSLTQLETSPFIHEDCVDAPWQPSGNHSCFDLSPTLVILIRG